MLKRWRNLPRAGVGLLGLALVLMVSVTADADSLRSGLRRLGGGQQSSSMVWGVPAGVDPASVPAVTLIPTVTRFSLAGAGSMDFLATDCTSVGLVCPSNEHCECDKATGTVTDGVGPIFSGTFNFWLSVDDTSPLSTPPGPDRDYPNGSTTGSNHNSCFFATGILAVTTVPGNTINFSTSGAACIGIGGGVALYDGGFAVTNSTGFFSSSIAGGQIGFGSNFFTGLGIFDLEGAGSQLN